MDYVERLMDWSSALTHFKSREVLFCMTDQLKALLYADSDVEYPLRLDNFKKRFSELGIEEYAARDVLAACERLLDVELLPSIDELDNPMVDIRESEIEIDPDVVLRQHGQKMREVLKLTLGMIAYFKQSKSHPLPTYEEIAFVTAKGEARTPTIVIKVNVELLDNAVQSSSESCSAVLTVFTQPHELEDMILSRLEAGTKIMVVGGHSSMHHEIERAYDHCKIKFIGPDEDGRIDELKKSLSHIDYLIEITGYSNHKLQQIVVNARQMDIPVASCNKKSIEAFRKALASIVRPTQT